MNPNGQHFLVIAAVENADFASRRQVPVGAPQEVMTQLQRCRFFECGDINACRIQPFEYFTDRAVLSRRIQGLKYQQNAVLLAGV